MLERNSYKLMLSLVFLFFSIVRVTAQGIPPGSASTDTGFGGSNTIGGMILVSNGTRAEHRISVRLQTMTRGDRVTTSDEYGNFVFRGVPAGEYTILIDREKEFEPFVQSVSVIQPRGMPAQTYNLSIRLLPKSVSPAKPGVINAELADVPKNALVHYNKAAELAKNKDQLQAIEELKLAIKEYPSFTIALNELGVQYLRLNKLEEADEAFRDALKIDPNSGSALNNRGIAMS
jgi:TolA-binding protein